nr:MAG TPA: hypothetical protein [Caudoviricetes sp.]
MGIYLSCFLVLLSSWIFFVLKSSRISPAVEKAITALVNNKKLLLN